MSRSYHATNRAYFNVKRMKFRDLEVQHEELATIARDVNRKRRVKQSTKEDRRKQELPELPPTAVETITVRVVEIMEHLSYPAGLADLRAVMERLPLGMLDGLTEVRLSTGLERCECSKKDHNERDPFLGRLGIEMFPGIWTGRVLGTYQHRPTIIDLYGFVCAQGKLDPAIMAMYCRLHMLTTFVHEVGHHCDAMTRVARGRWVMDNDQKVEKYADEQAAEMVREVVVPVLRDRFPGEVDKLLAWVKHHGGVDLSLDRLVSNWTYDQNDRYVPMYFGCISSAFEVLAHDVAEGKNRYSTRLEFARNLHYGEFYDEALASLTDILAEDHSNHGALTLQADIFVHQQNFVPARSVIGSVLAASPDDKDALKVLADVHLGMRCWADLLAVAERGQAVAKDDDICFDDFGEFAALARLSLRQFSDFWTGIEARRRDPWKSFSCAAICCSALLESGQIEEALAKARETKALRSRMNHWLPLQVIMHVATTALGQVIEPPELPEYTVELLRRRGLDDLAERALALME